MRAHQPFFCATPHFLVIANTLAAHGLEELFFQLCCCVSFWLWQEIVLGVTYTCHTSCGVVSFFWLQREIVLGCTDQFFGCGGK